MKVIVFAIASFLMFSSTAFAGQGATFVCESSEGRIETHRHPTDDQQVAVVAYKNEAAVYSHIFEEYHEASPVAAWVLTEIQNKESVIGIVQGTDGNIFANISLDLGAGETLRMIGASCSISL